MAQKGKSKTSVLVITLLLLLLGGGFYAYHHTSQINDGISPNNEGTTKSSTENDSIVKLTPEFVEAMNKYDEVYDFSNGLAKVKRNDKSGFINTKGEEVIPCVYDYIESFADGLALIAQDNKWGYINIKGEEVIPCIYDLAHSFTGGLDLIMTGVGFYGPYGWLISGGYFIGKYVLEDNNLDFWKK